MSHEIETKVLNIDVDKIKTTLISLGAKKIQDTRLVVDWFRPIGTKEGKDPWFLRVRSDSSGKHEVTWKAKSEIIGVARKHKEINFTINDPKKIADLFEELQLEQYAHQEKDRVSFVLADWQFDIDQYPNMPAYLEIESSSEQQIKKALIKLGLENNPTWTNGERILIQDIYKLNWYDMRF